MHVRVHNEIGVSSDLLVLGAQWARLHDQRSEVHGGCRCNLVHESFHIPSRHLKQSAHDLSAQCLQKQQPVAVQWDMDATTPEGTDCTLAAVPIWTTGWYRLTLALIPWHWYGCVFHMGFNLGMSTGTWSILTSQKDTMSTLFIPSSVEQTGKWMQGQVYRLLKSHVFQDNNKTFVGQNY